MATRTITIAFRSNLSTTDPVLAHPHEVTEVFTSAQLAAAIAALGSRSIATIAQLDAYLKDIQEQALHDRNGV